MVLQLPTDAIGRTKNEYDITSLQDSSSHGLGSLVLQGAHFGSEKRTGRKMWQKAPYRLSLPYVRNSMTRDAYEFLRRNIHFADNTLQQPEGTKVWCKPGWITL